MTREGKDLEKALDSLGKKAERLQEDLELDEALDVLDEAVGEVENIGEALEEAGS